MNRHHGLSKYFPTLFLVADLVCLNLSFYLATLIRFDWFPGDLNANYLLLQIALNLIWMIVFRSTKLRDINRNFGLLDHLNKILAGLVINLSIVFTIWFLLEPVEYSRKFLFITYLSFSITIVSWRSFWHYLIQYYRIKGYNIRSVLIIGKGELEQSLITYFNDNPQLGYVHIGSLEDKDIQNRDVQELLSSKENLDLVFCCLPDMEEEKVRDVINYGENNLIKVKLISQFSKLASSNLRVEQFGDIPVLSVNSIPLDSYINKYVKRSFDLIFSSLVLILVMSWLIPIVGVLIKLESKGSVFFKQQRHGKDNKFFLCWKFRTMTVDQIPDFRQATRNDNRITKVGAVLRKTSIDELPQFINVFLGNMSVVGPRPHPIRLNEEFHPKINKFWQRHAVKPGITGLAQAKGFRGETSRFSDMNGRIKLDRFYVKNWSLILDVKIIILTILSIIRGSENAY